MATRKAVQAAANAGTGSAVLALVEAYNDLAAKFDALTAKLDADAGITDDDYAAEIGAADTIELT